MVKRKNIREEMKNIGNGKWKKIRIKDEGKRERRIGIDEGGWILDIKLEKNN